jgi:hypothetical protein
MSAARKADPLVRLYEAWKAAEKRYDRACTALDRAEEGVGKPLSNAERRTLEREKAAADAEWYRTVAAIASTPARTVAGLAVKLRFVKRDVIMGPSRYAEQMVSTAVADALRLAKRGRR